MLYSVDRPRAPFAVMAPSNAEAVTPGVRSASDLKSRQVIGRLWIGWLVTEVVVPERVVSMMGAAAVTVRVSDTCGLSFMLAFVVVPRRTVTFGTVDLPRPASSASRRYVPGCNRLNVNVPSFSDTVLRVRPVLTFVAVTVTPGSAPPVESVMRPSTEPVLTFTDCANSPVAVRQSSAKNTKMRRFMRPPLDEWVAEFFAASVWAPL